MINDTIDILDPYVLNLGIDFVIKPTTNLEKLKVKGPILSIPVSWAINAVPQIKVVTIAQIIETDLLIFMFFFD